MNIACVIREQRRWGLNGLLTRLLYRSEGRGGRGAEGGGREGRESDGGAGSTGENERTGKRSVEVKGNSKKKALSFKSLYNKSNRGTEENWINSTIGEEHKPRYCFVCLFQLKIIYFTAQLNHFTKHLFYSVYRKECLKLCSLTCITASRAGISDTVLQNLLGFPTQLRLVRTVLGKVCMAVGQIYPFTSITFL